MSSIILGTAARLIVPMLLLFSIFLLARGHDEPGGGFAGGLVASAAFVLVAVARDTVTARRLLAVEPPVIVGVGLAVALAAGLVGLLPGGGGALLTGQWYEIDLPGGTRLDLGTPLLFDVGVYLVVLGTTLGIVLNLFEEQGENDPPDVDKTGEEER